MPNQSISVSIDTHTKSYVSDVELLIIVSLRVSCGVWHWEVGIESSGPLCIRLVPEHLSDDRSDWDQWGLEATSKPCKGGRIHFPTWREHCYVFMWGVGVKVPSI